MHAIRIIILIHHGKVQIHVVSSLIFTGFYDRLIELINVLETGITFQRLLLNGKDQNRVERGVRHQFLRLRQKVLIAFLKCVQLVPKGEGII